MLLDVKLLMQIDYEATDILEADGLIPVYSAGDATQDTEPVGSPDLRFGGKRGNWTADLPVSFEQ